MIWRGGLFMGVLSLSKLLFTLNIFSGSSWANLFMGLWAKIGRIFYVLIIVAIGRIADICQLIFKKLAGISPSGVKVQGVLVQGDPVLGFINTDIVKNIFFALLVLAIVMLLITTFVATIKTEFAKDGNNNKRIVIKHAFRGLANFVLIPVICIFGLVIGNALLRAIDGATSIGGATTLSAQVFMVGGYNANRARKSEEASETGDYKYKANSFGEKLKQFGNFGVFLDDTSGINRQSAADKIDTCFAQNYTIKVGVGYGNMSAEANLGSGVLLPTLTGISNIVFNVVASINDLTTDSNVINYNAMRIWYDGACGSDLFITMKSMAIGNNSVGENLGVTSGGILRFNEGDTITCSLFNIGLVYYYYDLTLSGFDYLICTISLLFCSYILLIASLGLVKRLFLTVTLFIVSAPICATYPIDGGKILERWRTEFIKNALSAYSTVVIMNIFLALLPLVSRMELFTDWVIDLCPIPIPLGFANYLAKIMLVIGGLLFFKDGSAVIAGIIGAGDATGEGSKAAKGFAGGVMRLAAGGALLAGAAKHIGKGVANKVAEHKDKKFMESEAGKALAQQDAAGKANAPTNTAGGPSMNGGGQGGAGGQGGQGGGAGGAAPAGGAGGQGGAGAPPAGGGRAAGPGGGAGGPSNGLVHRPDGSIDWRASRKQHSRQEAYDKGEKKASSKAWHRAHDEAVEGGATGRQAQGKGLAASNQAKKDYAAKVAARRDRQQRFVAGGKKALSSFGRMAGGFFGAIAGITTGKASIRGMYRTGQGMGSEARQKKDKEEGAKAAEKKMRTDVATIARGLQEQQNDIREIKAKVGAVDSTTREIKSRTRKPK